MAKFVIAGRSDCPHYVKAELLADDIKLNLPAFDVFKIPIHPRDWIKWVETTKRKHDWAWPDKVGTASPLIWRELIDRGGKGVLIGGADDFQEYVYQHYGIKSLLTSENIRKMSEENYNYKNLDDKLEAERRASVRPLVVTVTNATHPITYCLAKQLVDGTCFGRDTEVEVRLYSPEEESQEFLRGTMYEIRDLACPLFRNGSVHHEFDEAAAAANVVIFLDEFQPDGTIENELERKVALLKACRERFEKYASILREAADSRCRLLVAGLLPTNLATHTLIQGCGKRLSRYNIAGMSRYLERVAKTQLSRRLKVNPAGLEDLVVWGSVNGSTLIDCKRSKIKGYDGAIVGPGDFCRSVPELVYDKKWLENEFPGLCTNHFTEMKDQLKKVPAGSYAMAISDLLADWFLGANNKFMYSLAVSLEGEYGLDEGVVFSVPVKFHPGAWEIVEDLDISNEDHTKLKDIAKEFLEEVKLSKKVPTPPESPRQPTLVVEETEKQEQPHETPDIIEEEEEEGTAEDNGNPQPKGGVEELETMAQETPNPAETS